MQMVQADAQFQILCVSRLQYRSSFLSLCRDVLLKLHGGMEKGVRWVCVLRETWICRNVSLKQIHSIVVWKMRSYTHTLSNTQTHTHTQAHLYVSSSPGSSLCCSLLIFGLRDWGEGKRQNRRRSQGDVPCPTPSPDVHIWQSHSREEGARGTPGAWPALSRGVPCLTKTLGPVSSTGLSSGAWAAKWVFNIYLKERVGTKRGRNELQVWERNHTFVLLMLFPLLRGD